MFRCFDSQYADLKWLVLPSFSYFVIISTRLVSAVLGLVDPLFAVFDLFVHANWSEAMVNLSRVATAGASGGLSVLIEFGLLGLPVLL